MRRRCCVKAVFLKRRRVRYVSGTNEYLFRLAALPGITVPVPKGAFYLLPDISAYLGRTWQGRALETGVDFAEALLAAAGVPGEAFGKGGAIRISYSDSSENLALAMDRFEEFLLQIK